MRKVTPADTWCPDALEVEQIAHAETQAKLDLLLEASSWAVEVADTWNYFHALYRDGDVQHLLSLDDNQIEARRFLLETLTNINKRLVMTHPLTDLIGAVAQAGKELHDKELAELRQENARLRQALEQISKTNPMDTAEPCIHTALESLANI